VRSRQILSGRRRASRVVASSALVVASALGLGLTARIVMVARRDLPPDAILVLGSDAARMQVGAALAGRHPHLPVWISDFPYQQERNRRVFLRRGVAPDRIFLDTCATDTVSNFTCTVNRLRARGVRHVYLVTSDYHMARSRAIATLVFGSHGIAVTPAPVASRLVESWLKVPRDCARALLWLVTGHSGARWNPKLRSPAYTSGSA
jgi:uncharacterized SAM-binding protein YcdF (DUF218 family)